MQLISFYFISFTSLALVFFPLLLFWSQNNITTPPFVFPPPHPSFVYVLLLQRLLSVSFASVVSKVLHISVSLNPVFHCLLLFLSALLRPSDQLFLLLIFKNYSHISAALPAVPLFHFLSLSFKQAQWHRNAMSQQRREFHPLDLTGSALILTQIFCRVTAANWHHQATLAVVCCKVHF